MGGVGVAEHEHHDADKAAQGGRDHGDLFGDGPQVLASGVSAGGFGVHRPQHDPADHHEACLGGGDTRENAQRYIGRRTDGHTDGCSDDDRVGEPWDCGQGHQGSHAHKP